MKRNPFIKNRAIVALIFVLLLAVMMPVSAIQMRIDLGKTFQFKLSNISTIEAIDIGNLTLSRVEVQSTEGGDTDLQTIHTPVIRHVTRNFTTMNGTFNAVSVNITGENPSTVDYSTKPEFKIYTKPIVPTIDISVPGHTGNPMITKYNDSWVKEDTGTLSSLFRSVEGAYLYKTAGAAYANPATGSYLTSGGVWDVSKPNNLTYTLDENKVADLGSFAGDSTASYNLGDSNPTALPTTGKYYASAILHDEAAKNISVYAMYPIVVLNGATPIQWTNTTGGPYTAEQFIYNGTRPEAVTLGFSGSNPDLGSITNVTYLFINDVPEYDLNISIDTSLLAERAETRWQTSFTPGTQVIDLLYECIANDVGTPFNYTLTAVGYTGPAPSTEWSTIAITPYFGISGNASATSVAIPEIRMRQLIPGTYDVYLMGTDAQNNIVALDQKKVIVTPALPETTIGTTRSGRNWFLDFNGNGRWDGDGALTDRIFAFGLAGDLPVTGDWNGDGLTEVGVNRAGRGWFLDYNGNGRWDGPLIDNATGFGLAGDIPVSGDWNNDGKTEIGVLRAGRGWFLDMNGNGHWDGFIIDQAYGFGLAGDLPVSGDWNGVGPSDIGTHRAGRGWFLDMNNNGTWDGFVIDRAFGFGLLGDLPVSGDWNKNGTSEIAAFRDGHGWFLDMNGNGHWDGFTTDRAFGFGLPGDLPVTGKWQNL